MPITIQKMSAEELTPLFGRRARSAEDVGDYVDILRDSKLEIGSGLSLKTQIVTPDEGDSYTILADSVDESDPAGVTVRTAKRRFNLAAKEMGFGLDWREVNGWIIMKAVESKPETSQDGAAD